MKYIVLLACLTFAGFFTGEITKNTEEDQVSQYSDILDGSNLDESVKVELLEFSPLIITATR